MGAAISTLIAFILLYLLYLGVSNHYFKIIYEYRKLIILFCVSIVFFFLSQLLNGIPLWTNISLKFVITLIFPFVLAVFSFYETNEISVIKKITKSWKNSKAFWKAIKKKTQIFYKINL